MTMSNTKLQATSQKHLLDELNELRHSKHAILLGHYYANPDVQEVCDYVGDSLGLSREAANTLWRRRLLFWLKIRRCYYPL